MNNQTRKQKKLQVKPGRHSMRTELSFLLLAMIILALLLMGLAILFGLQPYYERLKTERLISTYEKLDALSDANEDLSDEIWQISEQDNISITIANEDFDLIASTSRNAESNVIRMFGFYTGFYNEDIKILREEENYTLQETSERRIRTSYLEMWGELKNGDWFLLQTPLQSMNMAANISFRFFVICGLIISVLSTVVVSFLVKRYTGPIEELNVLAGKMANQDFNARYHGREKNEIGELGASFNKMSSALESTISELKAANVELQRDNERKTKVDEVRKEFLNNVSHELKTPIALIQGYAEGLRDNVADDADSREFYCDVIIDEAGKMNTMVKKLLTLNQLEFGNDPVVMERFDLTTLIKGVISGMQLMISDAGAKVQFIDNGPLYVWGDEFKIEEVVTNYLSNAVHHCTGDKVIEIKCETFRDDSVLPSGKKTVRNYVRTTVFNTGTPIPEDDIGHVFEKFYKVDKARTREYGGSGIGLSIVKAIMDGHQEECGVVNYENGVAFYFTLSCDKMTADAEN